MQTLLTLVAHGPCNPFCIILTKVYTQNHPKWISNRANCNCFRLPHLENISSLEIHSIWFDFCALTKIACSSSHWSTTELKGTIISNFYYCSIESKVSVWNISWYSSKVIITSLISGLEIFQITHSNSHGWNFAYLMEVSKSQLPHNRIHKCNCSWF
jgi:hypothetical protein